MSNDKEYPDFVKSTGYGTVGGLCGINCRHNFIPFNPETMTNNLQQYGLEENKEMYENHQKQRYFERNIRKYKKLVQTEKTALKSIVDENMRIKLESVNKRHELMLKKWNKSYKDFGREKGLRVQPERLKV